MADSFNALTRTPTAVKTVVAVLDVTAGTPNTYGATYHFDVLDAGGVVMDSRGGNLIPHATAWALSAAQKTALGNCANVAAVLKLVQDYLLTKAEGAIG